MTWRPWAVVAVVALAACSADRGPSDAEQRAADALLTPEDLGAGWLADDVAQPQPLRSTLDPPCPIDVDPVDFAVEAVAAALLFNEDEMLSVNHTAAVLTGDSDAPAIVRDAWLTMDCAGGDFAVEPFDGVPDELAEEMIGFEFTARSGPLVQVVLVRSVGDAVSYLVVSGNDEAPGELARELADDA